MMGKRHEAEADALLEEIARFHSRGWCEATSGNYSVVVSGTPLELLVTRSGADKGRLSRDDLLRVDGDGRPAEGEPYAASAEVALHVMLARETGARAVLHTHSIWNTLLGERFVGAGGLNLEGYELLKAFAGVSRHDTSRWVPIFANTQNMEALAAAVPEGLRREDAAPGFLIAGHGLYAWGSSLRDAVRHIEAFEFLFEVVGRRVRFEPIQG